MVVRRSKVVATLVAVVALATPVLGGLLGGPGFLIGVALVVIAGLLVPELRRPIGLGVAGGAVAGLLVLGPAFRVAMRVVAIMDPFRRPEFTLGGTLFIVVFFGGIAGMIFGIVIALLRDAWAVPSTSAAIGVPMVGVGVMLLSSELRSEFFDLGGGALVNVPMFGLAWLAYGVVTLKMIGRLERRRRSSEPAPA